MKGNCGECDRRWYCDIDPGKCDEYPDPVPMTNADRIRAMSDEELENFINNFDICDNRTRDECMISYCGVCSVCVLDWLQQPAEGE